VLLENAVPGFFGKEVSRARYYQPGSGRFWTMDNYKGQQMEPPSLHKYLYCEGNPANHVDPLGLKIALSPDVQENRGVYNETIAYLKKSVLASNVIEELEKSSATYTISFESSWSPLTHMGNDFDSGNNTVHWDPSVGIEHRDDDGTLHRISPAVCLIHELGHAYHKDTNPGRFTRNSDTPDEAYDNLEEKATIVLIENPVAKDLGQWQRPNHQPNTRYRTQGPTSTTPGTWQEFKTKSSTTLNSGYDVSPLMSAW
jgi:hypothetical protein